MFIGHFALGFAAKRVVPGASLAALIGAAQLADLLWPPFVALGLEHFEIVPADNALLTLHFTSFPYSHSLLMLAIWGVIFGWLLRAASRDPRAWGIGAALVLSHWLLDFVTHRPDMPLYPGGPKFGLGLWNSMPATLVVETLIYVIGVSIYVHATRARDRIGLWAWWMFAAFLFAAYLASLTAPAPPSVEAVYIPGIIASLLLLLWIWWADRHREVRS
jgi:membrane-bound metal-dependent hydrolase YbcI (DUF457 family)